MNDVIKKTDHRILFSRLGICACNFQNDGGYFQMDLFTDYEALNKEQLIHSALLEVRTRYGANAILKGINLLAGATIRFTITDYRHAYMLVFEYIEAFYNTVRIHSHCNYMSPDEYERLYERVKSLSVA